MFDRLTSFGSMAGSRPVWAVATAAAAAGGIWLGRGQAHGTAAFVACAVLPDIALMVGIGSGLEKGQLHPRATRLYNTLHSLMLPAGLVIATTAFGWSDAGYVAALGWAAHIGLDRALGYGMRDKNGFQRGD